MKKLVSFAKRVRADVLLCCGAAMLLTACGGNMPDGTGQQVRLAAVSYNTPNGSSAMVASSAATPAESISPAEASAPVEQGIPAEANAPAVTGATPAQDAGSFGMSGYGATLAADGGHDTAQASGDQAVTQAATTDTAPSGTTP
jgi:hypothetical protein